MAPFRRLTAGKGHYYRDSDGAKLDSVTKLLGDGLAKPALINWAANTTAGYAVDHWDELAREPVSRRLDKLKKARFAERDRAARRGTEVHGLAERLIQGKEVDVPDELAGHVESYVAFLDTWKPQALAVERPVCNRRWGYAGTFDAVVRLPDDRAFLMDIKTNRSGIFAETALQLAAYAHAEVYLGTDGHEHPLSDLDIVDGLAVWVRGDGYAVYSLSLDEQVHKDFLHVATVARWSWNSDGIVGDPLPSPEALTEGLT